MQEKISMDAAHDFEAKMPLSRKIPLGLQHVFAMFVGNLTPLLIIMGACGIAGGEFADLQVSGSAERDVCGRRGNAGAAVFHWPDRRQGADHHGYKLGLYRRVQQRCSYHGRRCNCVWRDYGRVHSRRSV